MKKKKTALVLAKLAEDSRLELTAMDGELSGAGRGQNDSAVKPGPWSRRFAASGKHAPLRPIRMS
jgi:hypothetical protein